MNQPKTKPNADVPGVRKITVEFLDQHAPGITQFLLNLPSRTETAFIRGLIYQWMLANVGTEDYQDRLMEVLDGPGGRAFFVTNALAPMLPQQTMRAPSEPRQKARPVAPAGILAGGWPMPGAARPGTFITPVPLPASIGAVELPREITLSKPPPIPSDKRLPQSHSFEVTQTSTVPGQDEEPNPFDSMF